MLLFSSPHPLPWHCTRVQQRVWSLSSRASRSSSDATCASFVPLRVCLWARSSTAWRLPCRQESASFSSTSFPCVSKERLSRRYRKQKRRGTQIRKSNSTGAMKPWATSTEPSPLGVPSLAWLCRFLCSCFLRRSPWPAFADPSLFGALQLRSRTPELIPSKWDPKQASSTSLSMLTFAPWPKLTQRRGRHRQEGRLDLLWQRITQKLQIQPYGVLGTVGRVFSLRNRWAWCHAK